MIFTINCAAASLYAKPDEKSARVDEVLHGMEMEIEATDGDWLYIHTSYRYKGWLHRRYLAEKLELSSHYVSVAAADVLAEPKVQATLIECLTLGCAVRVISEEESGWIQAALADGRTGYMRSAFLMEFPGKLTREAVCQTAKLYLGSQYRWGGKSSLGIDCSGLCFMAYWLNGVSIYRDARIVEGFAIKKTSLAKAQMGDLVFFDGHVGMLIEDGGMLHSSADDNGVGIDGFVGKWLDRFVAVGSVF